MKILTVNQLKDLFKERHNRRGYYDFMKVALGILVSIIALTIFLYDVLERFELTTFDYRMRLRKEKEANPQVVLVDMGEDSIKGIGRWPWPREWHATVIAILSKFGAKAIVFDVIFSEASSDFSDAAMEEAMKQAGNVYVPYALVLEKFDDRKKAWNVLDIILPLGRFAKEAKGGGHITIVPDSDGTIRRIPLIVEYEGKIYPQLGLRAACTIMGIDPTKYKIVKTPFSQYIKIGEYKGEAVYIPVDRKNQILVNWVAKWGEDFKHYSYVDVITSYQNIVAGKKPIIDLNEFKDKICIIGLTAAGLYDIKPNPLQPTYPAVGTNANIISSVLNEDFIKKAPRWLDGLIIIILGLLLSMSVTRVHPIRGAYITVFTVIAYLLASFTALSVMKTWISVICPLMTIISVYLVTTFYNQIVISIERARLYALATRDSLTGLFVIRHFNLLLETEIKRVKTRGGRLSVLMLDIDHFKNINDKYGHPVGDFILKEVASIMMSCCRQLDIPSRYGGEEFIVMLPGADINDAAMVAERMRRKVEEHTFKMGDNTHRVTISLGLAMFKTEETIDALIKRVDAALYKAKEAGRNRVSLSEEADKPL